LFEDIDGRGDEEGEAEKLEKLVEYLNEEVFKSKLGEGDFGIDIDDCGDVKFSLGLFCFG